MGPNATFAGTSCTTASACTAVGDYFDNSNDNTLAEGLGPSGWAIQTTPNLTGSFGDPAPNALTGVSCVRSSSCEAVGSTVDTDVNNDTCPVAMRWNGTSWQQQQPLCPGSNPAAMMGPDAVFNGISCTAEHACTAVGSFNELGRQKALVERYS